MLFNICSVCLPWKRCCLEGICCSKTFIYLPALIVTSKTWSCPYCTYAPPYHQRCWVLNWALRTYWKVSLLSPEDMSSVISNRKIKSGIVWPWNIFPPWSFDTTACLLTLVFWKFSCTHWVKLITEYLRPFPFLTETSKFFKNLINCVFRSIFFNFSTHYITDWPSWLSSSAFLQFLTSNWALRPL